MNRLLLCIFSPTKLFALAYFPPKIELTCASNYRAECTNIIVQFKIKPTLLHFCLEFDVRDDNIEEEKKNMRCGILETTAHCSKATNVLPFSNYSSLPKRQLGPNKHMQSWSLK